MFAHIDSASFRDKIALAFHIQEKRAKKHFPGMGCVPVLVNRSTEKQIIIESQNSSHRDGWGIMRINILYLDLWLTFITQNKHMNKETKKKNSY